MDGNLAKRHKSFARAQVLVKRFVMDKPVQEVRSRAVHGFSLPWEHRGAGRMVLPSVSKLAQCLVKVEKWPIFGWAGGCRGKESLGRCCRAESGSQCSWKRCFQQQCIILFVWWPCSRAEGCAHAANTQVQVTTETHTIIPNTSFFAQCRVNTMCSGVHCATHGLQ